MAREPLRPDLPQVSFSVPPAHTWCAAAWPGRDGRSLRGGGGGVPDGAPCWGRGWGGDSSLGQVSGVGGSGVAGPRGPVCGPRPFQRGKCPCCQTGDTPGRPWVGQHPVPALPKVIEVEVRVYVAVAGGFKCHSQMFDPSCVWTIKKEKILHTSSRYCRDMYMSMYKWLGYFNTVKED